MSREKKVLLVKCLDASRRNAYSFRQIPLGIAYLAATLKGRCDLRVFDMLVDDGLEDIVTEEQPDIIGFSIFSVDFTSAKNVITRVREIAPNALIVSGGAHATVEPEHVLNCGIDLVIRGEAEYALREIVDLFGSKKSAFDSIPGISFHSSKGFVHTPIRLERIIDRFPLPAFEVFDRSKYTQYPILTSRGCPFDCAYCASKTIWGQQIRFHSAERVMTEIKRVVEDYDVKKIVFIDDTFTLKHSRLFKLCELLSTSGYSDVTWSVNSRVDTINDRVAEAMSRAGCKVISFGIETGSEFLQTEISKKVSIKQMKAAVQSCRKFGIRVKTGWMIGLPPGDYDEQMKSLDVMLELQPDEITIHHFIPMPGTPYWKNPERYGIEFDKDELLSQFSIDTLPDQLGLKFQYLSGDEIVAIIEEMLRILRAHGYKQPGEISEYNLESRVINTYMDKGRLSVLPSQ